jgi:uncharacterized membrane protein YgaE (UPF0421/DUF939 family)
MLNRIEWKIALKTSLSASISLFLSLTINHYFKRPDSIISGLWAALAAIVVQQAHLGSTYQSAWLRFLGVLIGSLMGGMFTLILGSNSISLGIGIFLTIIICSLFNIKDSLRIACLSVAVVMVLWGIRPTINPWVFGFYRFLDSCLGIGVAVIIAHLLWPLQISKKLKANVALILEKLQKNYLLVAQSNQLVEKQHRIVLGNLRAANELIWKSRQVLEDSKLELLSTHDSLEEWKFLFNHLDIAVDRIVVLNRAYKDNLSKIIDVDLTNHFERLIDNVNLYMQNLIEAITTSTTIPEEIDLAQSLERLNDDLMRFRKTKKTSQFKLEDVEGFFVFFYSIRSFAEELSKISKHLEKVIF